jgi:outer membrane protein assembly factor BamB
MRFLLSMYCAALLLVSFAIAADSPGDWPHWRGPNDDGVARGDAPLHWSDTEHIAWKAHVPGRGHSSPVVWGDRIFLTTAVPTADLPPPPPSGEKRFLSANAPQVEHKLMLLCFDRKTGKLLWEKVARTATPHEGYHPQYGSFASNSPVTDGKHVIASFGSRGVYCYTLDGQLVWEKDLGIKLKMRLAFGEGSWPALDGNTLVLVFDHEGDSFIVALDKNTGRELWRTPREGSTNWSGPLITTHNGRKQVIVAATKKVCAYDLVTGKLIWETTGLGANTVPAPVASGDLAYVMSGYRNPNLMAVRMGREGDLTGTDAIVWQTQRGTSYTASPVLHEGKLYVLTDNGMLSCFDAKTGTPYYQQARMPGPHNFKASPVAANGKLYLASEEGDVIVVRMGEKFEVVATNSLADQIFIATPAIVGGDIYLRGQNTLFCIR